MPRIAHGSVPSPGQLQELQWVPVRPLRQNIGFLFLELQRSSDSLLPQSPDTPALLKALGRTMADPGGDGSGDIDTPVIYVYLGQFIDHDIVLESTSLTIGTLLAESLTPLPLEKIYSEVANLRTASLNLDSVYGPLAPRDRADANKMLLGQVTNLHGVDKPSLRPQGKGDDNDLPREPRSNDLLHDRAALVGDPRNDENLIVSQMHVAFLKAHNRLVDQGRTFDEARRRLRQHYQHIVIHDFLKRIADPAIVDNVVQQGNRFFNASAEPLLLPLEFSVAAFRFGHSMVRDDYDLNLNFNRSGEPGTFPANLQSLSSSFNALSGELGQVSAETLPENWIIEWEYFVDADGGAFNRARRLDTKLVAPGLFELRNVEGRPEQPAPDASRLAVRNLLRGYGLRMPTGQALATYLGVTPLSAAEVEAAAASPAQVEVLQDGGFLERTPLWYYLLAEAKHHGGGQRLGPVGSTIVAEVLIGLVRGSQDSILLSPGWSPSLPCSNPGRFELADLLRFAGVLSGGQ